MLSWIINSIYCGYMLLQRTCLCCCLCSGQTDAGGCWQVSLLAALVLWQTHWLSVTVRHLGSGFLSHVPVSQYHIPVPELVISRMVLPSAQGPSFSSSAGQCAQEADRKLRARLAAAGSSCCCPLASWQVSPLAALLLWQSKKDSLAESHWLGVPALSLTRDLADWVT